VEAKGGREAVEAASAVEAARHSIAAGAGGGQRERERNVWGKVRDWVVVRWREIECGRRRRTMRYERSRSMDGRTAERGRQTTIAYLISSRDICGITSSSDSKKASTDSAYYYSTTTTIKLGINEQKCNALKYDALYINTVGDSGEPCKIYTSTCYTHTTGCAGKELGLAVMLAGSSLAIFRLVFLFFPHFIYEICIYTSQL
jgi:hypothetical protein